MIKVVCHCGHVQNLADRMGGKFTRCPSCQGSVSVPDAPPVADDYEEPVDNSALNLDSRFMKSPVKKLPAAAPGVAVNGRPAAPPKIACPSCNAEYAMDVLFCPKCAVILATGEPVAGLVPGGSSAPRARRANEFHWQKWLAIAVVLTILAVVAAMVFRSR